MSRSCSSLVRAFSSSASSSAGRSAAPSEAIQLQRRKGDRPTMINNIQNLTPFQFNDTTTFGYLRMYKMREAQALLEKVTGDDAALKNHHRPFVPPKSSIRISQTIDLTNPDIPINHNRSILVPVATLPLNDAAAIHRFKLIAGPRWTPGRPGLGEEEIEKTAHGFNGGPGSQGREGWIKISEDRFAEGRMNRKSLSDMLDRLIAAANDKESPLSTDIPIDTRHIIARTRRRRGPNVMNNTRSLALKERPEKVGGVKGYPVGWLSPAVVQKAAEGRERAAGKSKVAV